MIYTLLTQLNLQNYSIKSHFKNTSMTAQTQKQVLKLYNENSFKDF